MNQCLHCNKPCRVTSLFCDQCEALLQNQQRSIAVGQHAHVEADLSALATSPQPTVSSVRDAGQANGEKQDISKRITAPHPGVRSTRISQPSIYSAQVNRVEQALNRLSSAARRIAAADPGGTHHKPKSPRLSPLRDISSEIQRQSTPLPPQADQLPFTINNEQKDDLDGGLPDLWPWLNDGDSGEIDADSWSNRTDPLISRHFPDSIEAARIEEEDMRRAAAGGLATFSLPVIRKKRVARLRFAFAGLALLAILAITIDSVLVSFVFLNKQRPAPSIHTGPPSLTLSSSFVTYGQTVTLHIRNFSPSTRVYITRDVNEPISLNTSNITFGSNVQMDRNGNADAFMYIQNTWDAGYHYIGAEDTKTHYTARTSLHISNAGPTLPPHLTVDDQEIDLGSELQGANSIHPLHMHNSGSGSITWSANSTQAWLFVSPGQGTFSDSQTISVAGQRANLKPGDYEGLITISSNIGMSATVQVDMTVRSLPTNAGAVLQVEPALLSFTATDGDSNPPSQSLVISNPGSRPLHWSLSNSVPPGNSQAGVTPGVGTSPNWLSTDHTMGTVMPRATSSIGITAQIQNLLPGAYTGTLVLTGDKGTINSPQSVNVSLTLQPRCSLQLSTNMLSFTAVLGQGSPNTQALSLSANAGCPGVVSWSASTPDPWLTIISTNYQLKGMSSTTATVGVNINGLQTGVTYNGTINVTVAQSTQSVLVQLIIQPAPPPGAPILAASPMNVNFSLTQGQPTPPSQIVSITNTGESPLYWSQVPQMLGSSWLGAFPKGGVIQPKQTGQLSVNVRTVGLSAGIFNGTITINGRDANGNIASGSPQVVTVNLNLQAPCTLAPPAASVMAFTATAGGSNPASQVQSLTASGNCAWPVAWSVTGQPSWLSLSSSSGTFGAGGQSALFTATPITGSLAPGTYTAQINIVATDSTNMALMGSPQSFTVSFTVQIPCSLQVPSSGLKFTVAQGQSPPARSLNINESGSCALPVAWGAAVTSSHTPWLVLSAPSGTDSGNGSSVNVSINTAGLAPGQYTGIVTVSASDNVGNSLQGSPQTVPITLTVTGFTLSGTVNACSDSACSNSASLANATLALTDGSGKQFNIVADASGNYTFNGVALGSCTIMVSGSSGTTSYTGNTSLKVVGNQANIIIKAY